MNITERVRRAQLPRYDTNQDTESRNLNQQSRFKVTLPGKSFGLLEKTIDWISCFLLPGGSDYGDTTTDIEQSTNATYLLHHNTSLNPTAAQGTL